MTTYFDNMNDVNPEDWKLACAVVYETDLYGGKHPYIFDGYLTLDEAFDVFSGKCSRCNHNHMHFVIMENKINGDLISIGWDCYNSTFAFNNRKELNIEKAKEAAERAAYKADKKAKAAAYKAEHSDIVAFLEANQNNRFFESVLDALNTYGGLTEKQEAAVVKNMKAALEPKEDVVKCDAPEGRITDTFTVVSVKFVENDFGGTLKMKATSEKGYSIWVTVPDKIKADDGILYCNNVEKGHKIQMSVDLTRSDTDASFAFGKRPTKPVLVS